MYQLVPTTKFKKDIKKLRNNLSDFKKAVIFLNILELKGVDGIDSSMKPHKLKGNYADNWECHIKPYLLIILIQIESPNVIKLVRIGSHSDLFK